MITFIRKKLELKIIITLAVIIAVAIGISTYVDMQHVRSDMIRTSERTLGVFAGAIKASVSASMKKGQHQVVPEILSEIHATEFIDRLTIYSEQGRPLHGREILHGPDVAASRRELGGVLKQVADNLGDAVPVGADEQGNPREFEV